MKDIKLRKRIGNFIATLIIIFSVITFVISINEIFSWKNDADKVNDLTNEINKLIKKLEKENYNMVSNDIDWNIYENADKDTKIAAFTPIKYGMCWYE